MPSSSTLSPKIIAILLIPVILLVALISAVYLFPTPIPNQMDLKVTKLDGSTLQTTSLKGKILVVEFMATWCVNCLEISQNIANILKNNSFSNVVFLSVSIDPTHDTSTVLTNFIENNGFAKYALNSTQWYFTRDTLNQYSDFGVSVVPHTFLVNNGSIIIDQHLGYLSYDQILSWITNETNVTTINNNTNTTLQI